MKAPNTSPAHVAPVPNEPPMNPDDLAALAVAFGVLSRAFWEEPQDGIVDALAASRADLAGEPFASIAPLGAADLECALDAYAGDPKEQMGLIKQDRAYLFYEIGYSRTSPYESAYRTPDRTLFGPTTEQVKHDYERHGLAFERRGNEPSDHFALECAYVQQIALAGVDAADCGDQAAFEGACNEVRRFLSTHLLVFAPVYLHNLIARATTVFYRSLGEVALETVRWAAKRTGARPVEVLDQADFPLQVRQAGKEY